MPVGIVDDALVEAAETLSVTLSGPAGAQAGSLVSHTLNIADEDSAMVTISTADAVAEEAGDPASVTFTRTGATTGALTVNYARSGTAVSGTDYNGLKWDERDSGSRGQRYNSSGSGAGHNLRRK